MTEMTSGIGDLLQRLRKDGVEAGEKEKRRIRKSAEDEANALVAEAEARAAEIVGAARREAESKRKQLDAELGMAARDFVFRFAERVKKQIIQPLIAEKAAEALNNPDVLKEVLSALVRERAGGARVTMSPETRDLLQSYFRHELARQLQGGELELISEDGLTGFRLEREGDSFAWDVTGESVARELSALVEPSLRQYLQIAPGKR